MRDALLIVNPTAGKGRSRRLAPKVTERLAAHGYRATPILTTGPGDATRLAREAAESGADAVLALGGDGTLREAAAGLLGTGVPLGPLPGGTTNVLTLALGLPRRPLAAAEAVARAAPRWLDVGLCGTTPFLMMASAGVDSAAVTALHPLGARWFGRVGVAARGLGIWWSYGYPPIEVTSDLGSDPERGGTTHRASFVAVTNIPLYGGPFRLVPTARPDDRRLDLLLFRGAGRSATLGFARDVLRGKHLARPDVDVLPVAAGASVTIRAPRDLRVQMDGDPCPHPPPVTIGLAPERLTVLAPGFD